nr:DNA gyrase C-terminal beta-propeller domain-containing protein [Spiroplasma clarkii]
MILTLSEDGYLRRLNNEDFKAQKRGGKGIIINSYPEDNIIISRIGKTKDDVLFFSDQGKVYKVKGYSITQFSRTSRGMPIINFIGISSSEKITSILSMKNKGNKFKYLAFVTSNGIVKKVDINEFERINNFGKIAINLDNKDTLRTVIPTTGKDHILIASKRGKIIKINENEFRPMSRSSRGVKGITLDKEDKVMSALSDYNNDSIATISELGIIKKTLISEYNPIRRGSKGIAVMKLNEKTGKFKAIHAIRDTDEIIMISSQGKIIKIHSSEIKQQSRNSSGVIGFNLDENEYITTSSVEYNKGG